MQLGISSYTYTWAVGVHGSAPPITLSAYDLVDKAVSHGLNLLQVADNLPLEDMTDEYLQDLCTYSIKQGIALEMGSSGLTPEHTLKCLKAAERMHSSILRMVIDRQGL